MSEVQWRVDTAPGFERGLQTIAQFLEDAGAPQVLDRLLDDLEGTVFLNLTRFPRMGRHFKKREPESTESLSTFERLQLSQEQEVREYLHGDYLILYAVLAETRRLVLLSIRHGRQAGHG